MHITINGNKYEIPELTFDAVCELEERGINLMDLGNGRTKIATTIRGLVAWIMGTDTKTASIEIEKHLMNGGDFNEILDKCSEALSNAGFLSQKGPKQLQDHMGKQSNKVTQYQKNNQRNNSYPQSRSQRRHRNRNNGNHSQR